MVDVASDQNMNGSRRSEYSKFTHCILGASDGPATTPLYRRFFFTCFFTLLFTVLLFFQPAVGSTSTLKITPGKTEYQLGPYFESLEDTSGKLTITDVSSPAYSDQFTPNNSSTLNKGSTTSIYWFRFSLAREEAIKQQQWEEQPLENLFRLYLGKHLDYYDEIKFFWRKENKETAIPASEWNNRIFGMYQAAESGKRDPLYINIPTPQNDNEVVRVYMAATIPVGFFIEPVLYGYESYSLFSKRLSIFYGMYYGLVLSMIVYNLFHYYFLRDNVRLVFILYATTFCLYFVVANELALPLIPAEYLVYTGKLAQFLGLVMIIQMAYFSILFLQVREYMPIGHRFMQLVIILSIGIILLLPFFSYYSIGLFLGDFSLLSMLVILLVIFVALYRGFKPARFFFLGWSFFLAGGVVYVLNFKGDFPFGFIGNNALQIGSGIEMLLLSLAIAERVKYRFDKLSSAQEKREKQLTALTHQLVQTEEAERRRIAEVLHDSIGQTLCVTKWEVKRLLKSAEVSDAPDQTVLQYIDSCIEKTRTLTAELYPQILYQLGLKMALHSLAEEFSDKFGIEVTLDIPEELKMESEEVQFILYRVTAELLNNVFKHAEASEVRIFSEVKTDLVSLTVEDDGVGFDFTKEQNEQNGGFGLFSIRERLQTVNGSLQISGAADGGASFSIIVPKSSSGS